MYVYNSNGVGRIGNTLYISGGETYCGGSWHIDGGFWAYDPATNTLTRKPTPPKLTADGVTGVIDGKLYVLPGLCSSDYYPDIPVYCETSPSARLFRYNPATNLWATKQSAPHYHANGAGGVINGKFYVAGGANTTAPRSKPRSTGTIRRRTRGRRSRRCPRLARPVALSFRGSCTWSSRHPPASCLRL